MTARAPEIKSHATIEAMAKHRWLRRTFGLGLLAGAAYAVWRAIEANRVSGQSEWEPQPFPFPPQPRTTAHDSPPWVSCIDGACPATHPVKAKAASKIFHVPGGLSYERTMADRCYRDAAAAGADGFRAAKR
jgi:hypothetical protein